MPDYYCPGSSVAAYEVLINPELVANIRRSRRVLRDYVQSIADAIQRTASGNLSTLMGASQLRRSFQKLFMGHQGIRLGAIARPLISLQGRLNQALREFDSIFNQEIDISVNLYSNTDFDVLQSHLGRILEGITKFSNVFQTFVTRFNNVSFALDTALAEIEDTIINVQRGGLNYSDSILDGAAEGILVQFYDGSIYEWNASVIGDANIDTMIMLGEAQAGLGTFIANRVADRYS
ncbi:MAG: hypothetical protein OXU23_18355 [Candidatus Poribacteria bacterium]|nr:hypothetical protein [Candidatus Poribacteria bacterium]